MSDESLEHALPGYEVGGELGRGAMGEVHAGHHTRLDRDVAIKQLPEGFARDETVRDRFGDEARVLASLTHPHIVPVYDYVEEEGLCLLVMEALPGGTVWDRFTTDGLSMPTACAVVLATCAGLSHAHSRRVLHRDIKPENLMFDAEDTLKVTDFGIAAVLGGDESMATADGEIIGTPAYMAPEQAEGGQIGPQADVYAVGTMLYELLSGRLPFDESGDPVKLLRARLKQDPVPLDEVAPHVPEALVDATMKAIARNPADRYSGPEELGVAVARAAATAWGAEWRTNAHLRLMTSGPIAEAASAPLAPATITPSTPEPSAPSDDAAQPDATEAPGTVAPGADAGESTGGDGRGTVISGTEAGAVDSVITPTDQPEGAGARRTGGVDLVDAAPDDLVGVADLLEPPQVPWLAMAVTLVLVAAMALIGLNGIGEPDRTGDNLAPNQIQVAGTDVGAGDPVEVDLAENIPILVTDPPGSTAGAEVALSAMGVPLGTSSQAEVKKGPEGILTAVPASSLRAVPSGLVTADLRLLDEGGTVVANREFALDPDRPPYLSVGGVAAIVLALAVLAYGSSSTTLLRKGRRDRSAYPKMAIVGAIAGPTVTLFGWSFGQAELTLATMVVTAVLGAATGVIGAWCLGRLARRRRLRRVRPATV